MYLLYSFIGEDSEDEVFYFVERLGLGADLLI